MHRQDRHADVDGVDVLVGNVFGYRAAAAKVQLAHFADLPHHVVAVHQTGQVADQFGGSVAGAGLAAGTRIFVNGNAVARIGAVVRLKRIGKGRVKGRRHVGRQALGRLAGRDVIGPLRLAELLQEVEGVHAVQARHTVGAGLLFVRQHADRRVGGVLHADLRHQCGVSVHAVIMAVSADHGAVQADIPCLVGRNDFDLGAGEIPLGDAVGFVQHAQNVQLYALLCVAVRDGLGRDQNIQIFGGDALPQRLGVLLGAQVR